MKKYVYLFVCLMLMMGMTACSRIKDSSKSSTGTSKTSTEIELKEDESSSSEQTSSSSKKEQRRKVVVIDAGHQGKANVNQEPEGPYKSKPTKKKVTAGTSGKKTGSESALNLDIAMRLSEELEKRGYTVYLVRTSQDVNISNIERATFANEMEADAFVRIHADGNRNKSLQGMHTIAPKGTSGNTYQVGELKEKSYKLSQCILDGCLKTTGVKSRGVVERDDMSGHNWSKVPVTMLEMGFLTNAKEDQLLSTSDYRDKMVQGIANGLDRFFDGKEDDVQYTVDTQNAYYDYSFFTGTAKIKNKTLYLTGKCNISRNESDNMKDLYLTLSNKKRSFKLASNCKIYACDDEKELISINEANEVMDVLLPQFTVKKGKVTHIYIYS